MTKHGVHKNKPDKSKASKGPAESEVSPTKEVRVTMDESTSAQADGVIAQKLDLLLNSVQTMNEQLQQQDLRLRKQEERVSLNELSVVAPSAQSSPKSDKQSKMKTPKLPGEVSRPAKLPFEDLKSDSRIQAEVERRLQDYQQTSRTETAGKPVQSLKSGRYRAGVAKIHKHINWPQDFCSVASGNKQPTYDELTNEQWMQGFLFCILEEGNSKIRENMLQYLTYLMQDAIELSMNTARKAHAAVLQDMERGKVSWEELDLVEKIKGRNTQRLVQGHRSSTNTQDRIQPCIHFNKGNCKFESDHVLNNTIYQHVCSYCFRETGRKFEHTMQKCLRMKNGGGNIKNDQVKNKEQKA